MNLIKFNRHPLLSNWMQDFDKEIFSNETAYNGNQPAVNVVEDEKHFTLEMAAPGLK